MVRDEIISPNGTSLHILASSGGLPERKNLPEASDVIKLVSRSWFQREYDCGHRGSRKFVVSVYGINVHPTSENHHCPDCAILYLQKTVIKCASCELPIFPGDSVVLYHPVTPGLNLAVASFANPNAVICCMRWDCCTAPEFFAGHWSKNGFKQFSFDTHE